MRRISASDYLIEFFISNGITDVFGYQGGMVCHIFDSLGKYKNRIKYHSCGNEQGAAFAACGYAQATGKLGVVITTSGPGFTNALTGLSNAWFDSIPLMLISGQVNTKDKRRKLKLKQYGFQEIQAISMAKPIVKKTFELDDGCSIIDTLREAYIMAFSDRRGPVYVDFPINIERELVEVEDRIDSIDISVNGCFNVSTYIDELMMAKRPIIIAGGGIKQLDLRDDFRKLVELLKIPVVTTMPGNDLIPSKSPYRVGYIGGTARREAGIILKNTDCVLTLGTRLCNKAIGYNHDDFVPMAKKIMRVDIDDYEFERQVKSNEVDIKVDLRVFVKEALEYVRNNLGCYDHNLWVESINKIKQELVGVDVTFGNKLVYAITSIIPENANIVCDVGNNLVYCEQSSVVNDETRMYESAGLGAMGYSVPAAVGIAIGTNRNTYSFTGDGGAQMNVQELNIIAKLELPIKIIVFNNKALGHIIIFQDHYLDYRHIATIESKGDYYSCDFSKIANAYGIRSCKIKSIDDVLKYKDELCDKMPFLMEIEFDDYEMLPNIHGGLDPLINGPKLTKDVENRINQIIYSLD